MPILKNQRHELMVQEYLKPDTSQSDAFRLAYPASSKWKDKTVWEKSSALFANSKVKARIEELRAILRDKEIISKEEIIKDLEIIAKVTIGDYILRFDDEREELIFKPIQDWTPAMHRACSGIKKGKTGTELTVYGMKYSYDRISKMVGYDAPIKTETKDTTLADLLK